jgi:hypothetical protein
MKKILIITLALIITFMLSGCSSKMSTDSLEFSLKEQGLHVSDIDTFFNSVTITYDAALANEYDTQIIADWATIMATSASFNYTKITIINTLDGKSTAKIVVHKDAIDSYLNGSINDAAFWEKVDIKT